MKVLDLRCEQGHSFEGWFGSEDDYQMQRAKGMLSCPLCESLQVEKVLSAPYVAKKSNRQSPERSGLKQQASQSHDNAHAIGPRDPFKQNTEANPEQRQLLKALHAQWLAHSRAVLAKGQDVGTAFAQEARKIHEGEAPDRLIHGQASMQEVVELLEDGVAVLPLADDAKEPIQ